MAREKRFTREVIKAIEDLELRRARRSQEELADAAWQKLQYDLPVVETAELQALLQQLSSSLQGKTGWPCYCLTHKALDNITAGARRSGGREPLATLEEQQLQQQLSASLQRASSSAGASSPVAQAPCEQELYQQLSALLLLAYVAKVVSMPEQSGWQLLAAYQPDQPSSSSSGGGDNDDPAQQQLEAPGCTLASSTSVYELEEAAVLDEDGEAYEALDDAPTSSSSRGHHSHDQQQPHQQQHEQFSWQALRHKLLCLADSVHYSLLSRESVWQEQAAASHLLQLLRAVGVHSRSEELQPVLHVYVGLLVDRLAAEPSQLPLLQQLWEALGLAPGAEPCRLGPAGKGLPPEAVLGFSVAAAVWQQLPAGSARQKLWQMMHQQLLPMLEQCSEQLAYSSGRGSSRGSGSSSNDPQQEGAGFAHALLLAHIVELLLLGRPANADVSGELTTRGVTRNMVALFVRHATDPAAEPVRRAVLLACCASSKTAAWVLAVPAVLQQLTQQHFQPGHAAEAHGAVWQMLLRQQASATTSNGMGAGAACDQLLGLLVAPGSDEAASNSTHLQRKVMCLQLLVDVQAVAKRSLWDQQVALALRQLAAAFKASASKQTAACRIEDGGSIQAAPGNGSALPAEVDGPAGGDAGGRLGKKQTGVEQTALFAKRQAQQLLPMALRLIKQLLTQGGKTD